MNWIEKEKTYSRSQFDGEVIVQLIKRGSKTCTQFRFRKNSYNKITTQSESKIMVAVDGTRIYFKGTFSERGFTLIKESTSKVARIPKKLVDEKHCGEYNLRFDKENMLCYIELNSKLEKTFDWFGKRED